MTEETIFAIALEKPPTERAAYLAEACGGNETLRNRLEGLLAASEKVGNFMANPAVGPASDPAATEALPLKPDHASSGQGSTAADADDDALTFLAPPGRPDSLGRIGHYEMLQVLGRGGFGIVFRAFDDILQRVVALKVMAPQIATLSPARKRFVREAQSSAKVRHENVVQVYEVGEQPLPYLTMEFIPGETLQQKLDRSGPLDVPEVLRIGRQIAEGLAAAHACDLIHRDIKPGNIMLEGGSHKAKITDFGLARAADDASISQSGIIAGTPMFMAPEQALGHKIDQRADLFSFGSVLYQMASGRPPFRAPSALAVLKRVAEEPPRPIPEIIPETPNWLCGIIAKLHAKNPDDRFQSAREVADLLAACEAKLKAKQEVKNVLPTVVKPAAPTAAGRRWPWKRKLLIPVVVLLALLVPFAWPWVANYSRNRGELEILPGEGLVSVIVLQNDEGVLDDNKLHARVTDWLDMKDRHTLTVPPGKYQLNVQTWPEGTSVWEWEVSTSGLFASNQTWVQVVRTSAIITLERGQRVTLRPKMQPAPIDPAIAPKPVPVAKQETLPPTYKNSIGMEFVIVPKGKSWLGGGKDKLGDKEVEIPADFYLGKYEVTQEEWTQVMGENPSHFSRTGGGKDVVKDITDADLKRFPMENVSWNQCQLFVAKLNKLEKETGWVYRLPKEVEWEYACRGGPMADKADSAFDYYLAKPTNTLLPNGAKFQVAKGVIQTCKVGNYEPNRLGLFDMHGNVWEWCDGIDEDSNRVMARGGSVGGGAGDCRARLRVPCHPALRVNHHGLRLARVPSGVPSPEAKTPIQVVTQGPTYKNSIGMEFVIVPKGKSWLGGGKDKLGDKEVEIPADFYLGKYEVTQEEWGKVMGENPSHFSRTGEGKDAVKDITDADLKRFPVEIVSWDQCQLFVAKLNSMDKQTGWVYRLPKQTEWEYACRGGPMADKLDSAFDFYFAKPTNTLLPAKANFRHDNGLKRTCKVGSYEPNALGLYDMHGNVWEKCDDTILGTDGVSRPITRGSCWGEASMNCTTRAGGVNMRHHRDKYQGLRLARVPSGAPAPEAKTP